MMSNSCRIALALVGVLLIGVAVLLPSGWYFELPLPVNAGEFPVTGATLFKAAFLVEGFIILLLGVAGWKYQRIVAEHRLPRTGRAQSIDTPAVIWIMLSILVLGALLRSLGATQGFWIDEIATLEYTDSGLLDQITLFSSPNNHLLNTLLIKLSIAIWGESEWSARLPAIVFGVLTIPVFYWVTRRSLGIRSALAVTLLLAVSYHHIFFSQNARGYTAHLFLSLLATGLLTKGLRDDRLSTWAFYIAAMLLNFIALMNTVFVFMAHATAGLVTVILLARERKNYWPTFRRLFFVFLTLGILVFHFYAIKIPQIYVVLSELYADQATGFVLFSVEFFQEITRGVSAGFGTGVVVAALPFMFVAMAGFIGLLRRDLLLTLLLLLPGIYTGLYLVARDLTVSPRFFLFELFLVLTCAVIGVATSVNWLGTRLRMSAAVTAKVSLVVVVLLAIVSLASLHKYYLTPKQGYRSAVAYLERSRPAESEVIVVFTAGLGIAYYHAKGRNVTTDDKYTYVDDYDSLVAALDEADQKAVYIVTTFHRALDIRLPKILVELEQHWHELAVFPATIGDGSITIWTKNQSVAEQMDEALGRSSRVATY